MSGIRRISLVWVIVCLLLLGRFENGLAQADDALWSQPVNLSHSGAAESPLLLVGPERQFQVFWWDRFAGLTTAYTLDNDWSDPAVATIEMRDVSGAGTSARVVTSTLSAMPDIVGTGETALAFWPGVPDRDTGLRPLLYSRLQLGTTEWAAPEVLAESATAWEIADDSQGVLHLVYCQTQQLNAFPAGIYHVRSTDGGVTWSEPVALYTSLYARLWTANTVRLSIAADALSNVLVGWDNPRRESAFYVLSTDSGTSWREPAPVQDGEIVGLHPRFIVLPALASSAGQPGFVMLWEQEGVASTCVLLQQRSEDGGKTWSAASRVFESLAVCPAEIETAQTTSGLLLLLHGEGAEHLLATVWGGGQWSETRRLSFSFVDSSTDTMIYLEGLRVNVAADDVLVVVGQERNGDIWLLQGEMDTLEWVFAPPSPWSGPAIISEEETIPGSPAVATDAAGNVHVLWSASPSVDRSGSVLYYSRWDETSWSRPAVVLGTDENFAQMPALVFAEPFLHAVWSGGSTGTVFYSRSYPDDAFAASSWSAPSTPGETAVGSAPALTVDLLGRLHLVYAVPFNEDRGIYYTYTDDGGDSWQDAALVFDAVAEAWPSVDHPDVAIDEHGIIHVVWTHGSLPGYGLPQGVYYARSIDHGESWTNVMLLADGAYDWPQVAATLSGQVLVTWQDLTLNIVEYRVSGDYGLTWGYVSPIPGLQAVEGSTGLELDHTGRVHATALNTVSGSGVSLGHIVYAAEQWSDVDWVDLTGVGAPAGRMSSAVTGELGLIDVVGFGSWRGDDELSPVIWHTRRTIESRAAIEPRFAPPPTLTPTPGPTPVPTPTPRPAVNPYPPQSSSRVLELGPVSLPLLALGGIAITALLVGGLVLIKAMKR